jgi:hypothetical protein
MRRIVIATMVTGLLIGAYAISGGQKPVKT